MTLPGRRVLVPLALVAALAVALVVAEALSGTPRASKQTLRLPSAALQGTPVTAAQLRGRPAIVHFWASWCGPCIHEASQLARLPAALGDSARVVGVDWSDNPGDARAFVRSHHWTFPSLVDRDGSAGNADGISGLPTTFVLDKDGHVVKHLTGPQTVAALVAAVRAA